MSERVSPHYCPYCGEEDLRPHGETHGTWECRACTRVFTLKFVGLLAARGAEVRGGPVKQSVSTNTVVKR
jgi:ribosomal protein L37AE/L43A